MHLDVAAVEDGDATLLTHDAHRAQHVEMRRCLACLTIGLLLASMAAARAAPLFDGDTAIHVELSGPFSALQEDTSARDQLPFVLRAENVEHAIKVRIRGKSRLRVCRFPPLRLNFKKGSVADTVFAGQDKLKLVVPCSMSTRSEKDLVEEYAAYRIFNLLSDASYRVRLLHAQFSDPDDKELEERGRRYAFLIESTEALAERLNGEEADLAEVSLSWFDQDQLAIVYVFQYLIANTDWSLVSAEGENFCCHNGTLIKTDPAMFYIPYDFDLAGLVNAPYARPHPGMRISRVTERRYRGFCIGSDALRNAIVALHEQEQSVIDLIMSLPVLSDSDKNKRVKYLGRVLAAARDEDKLRKEFEKRCKR